ncbi:unnamed protein product, partial [Darwinula stevensoni]
MMGTNNDVESLTASFPKEDVYSMRRIVIAPIFGAILSVLFLYWKRFFVSLEFYFRIAYALVPTVIIAFLLKKYVDQALGSVLIVGINLLIGGFIMLYLESYFKKKTNDESSLKPLNYAFIGLFQAISIFPGVSRSAATIYGGMFQGMNRKDAAEFSFVLAVPIMFLATVKDLYDFLKLGAQSISNQEVTLLVFGNIVAFLVAILAIKFFVSYIVKYGFTMFAYYRILIESGVILPVYKPLHWTSFDVVKKIKGMTRKAIPKFKIGHAGTLDPLAEGLLIICTQKMTKQVDAIHALPKTYIATIFLGAERPSYDKETEVSATFPIDHLSETLVKETLASFL